MFKLLNNELTKAFKSKRPIIFTGIMIFLSIFFGIVVMQMEQTGMATVEMMATMKGGYFCIQILGLSSDIILPIFATLLVCFYQVDEYNNGTLKLPILCGYSRKTVILAKIFAVVIVMTIIMLATWLSANITSMIIWGIDSVLTMALTTLAIYLKTFIALIAWSVVMFTLSLFFQNSGTIIGVMTALLAISSIVGGMFPQIAQYTLPYYLKAFTSMGSNVNVLLGIIICFLSVAVFGGITLFRFRKMEIQK